MDPNCTTDLGDSNPGDNQPERIGPYQVLDTLGEGGMGTVYLAEQREPVRRRVAVKVVKLGMDSAAVLKRFEIERQALALMNHDAIARVFDAGTTDRGQLYFVMEHAPGIPLTDYCDRSKLSLEDRIRLFQKICAGVQHAHQKGVIHRDLKPSNVLVTEEQGEPKPKIIDFGLARATNQMALQASMFTEMGQILGTPEYMSPEQADPTNADIDTRTDVYALGVMLYELLIGERPFADLHRRNLMEMQRVILEEEPPRPSTKLSSQGDASTEVVARRRTNVPALTRALRSDLDWVVLKAMEKDRNRRYDSANGLAMDLGRYLMHEPLVAGPPTAAYRLRKLLQRYRVQVVASCLVVAALIAGLIGTLVGLRGEQEQRKIAEANEALASKRAEQIAHEKARAEDNARRLQKRTDEFDLLSLVIHLREARAAAADLCPAWPDKIPTMQSWLREDVGRLRAGLPMARAAVEALRTRSASAQTDLEASRRAHPRYRELEQLRAQLASRQHAQQVRTGKVTPKPFALDPALENETAKDLNSRAWPLVGPDRTIFGREAEGLALARLVNSMEDARGRALPRDTLAWALFANGHDREALAASETALNNAQDHERAKYAGYFERMRQAIHAARGAPGRTTLAELRKQTAALTDELTDWHFERESDRFLHDGLSQLLRDADAFLAIEVPRVEQRIAWAQRVAQVTVQRFEKRWAEARSALRTADGVVASTLYQAHPVDLEPQLGLIPIGMNPRTKLWEFYHLRTAWDPTSDVDPADVPIPTHGEDGTIEVTRDTGIVFVLLPGGTFAMGAQSKNPSAPNYDPLAMNDESPVAQVTLAPFFLARHELTQGQWLRLSSGDNPSFYKHERLVQDASHPVERVTWFVADEMMHRHQLLLPTEAQWEYGCRAGTTTSWWTGADRESLVRDSIAANLADQSAARDGAVWPGIAEWPELDDGWIVHAPVDALRRNPWGLYHVHGNVWEWCRDAFGSYRRDVGTGDGLRQVHASRESSRINRGGGFQFAAHFARSATRSDQPPTTVSDQLGLRAARALY